jgi:hypothetical protein
MSTARRWDMWVDFGRVYDGMAYGDLRDAEADVTVKAGRYLIVGDDDADPAVAQVVEVRADGVVLLKVLPGHADHHLGLLRQQPA